jgi:macrolide phosphotransferase
VPGCAARGPAYPVGVRSPLALAALATVAVPGFDARAVRATDSGGDDDTAVVTDAQNARWVVRAPRSSAAGAALEAELVLLGGLAQAVDDGKLPFDVPRTVGTAPLDEGGRAVMYRQLKGRPVPLDRLQPGPGTAAALGRAIGALHELPPTLIEEAGLPVYDAAAYRQRRQSEVDEAARTGRVPATLLRRWEERLEDIALWKFSPTVVHGDLSADHVLTADGEITGVLSWGEAKVADPADDLAWLLVAAPQDAVDSVMEAYQLRRTELTDPFIADRALLAGELALVRWLLYGVRTHDDEVIADAVSMLDELDEQTRELPDPEPVAD